MPLVVPGITSTGKGGSGDLTSEWMNKLLGKKLTESSAGDHESFPKAELPQNHRVIEGESMFTMDHNPDRLNVHVDSDGTVKQVKFG